MRVTYKQFYRRFGNLLTSKDTIPPSDDDITSAKVRGIDSGGKRKGDGERERERESERETRVVFTPLLSCANGRR